MKTLSQWITIAAILTMLLGCGTSDSDDSGAEEPNNNSSQAEENGAKTCQDLAQATPVDEVDSCESDDGCHIYSTGWIDADKIAESDDSCGDIGNENDESISKGTVDFCIQHEWVSEVQPSSAIAGYFHEEDDDWRIYILPETPWRDYDKMKFVPCDEIPHEAENARDACLECQGEGLANGLPG